MRIVSHFLLPKAQPFSLFHCFKASLRAGGWVWLGGRDSNPDSTVQSRVSYH